MTAFWLATRAGVIIALPDPKLGPSYPLTRAASVARTIGGGQVVAYAPGPGRRVYEMQWPLLIDDEATTLEEVASGAKGPGPFGLLDSARRNHLSANQSSATSVGFDTTGFSVAPGSREALTSCPDAWLRGPRSLRWTLPDPVVAGLLELDPPAGLVGVPTPAALPWIFHGRVTITGLAPSVTVTPTLSWRRADASEVAATSGTPVVVSAGAWATFSVTLSAPPAGAVAVRAQLRVTPGALGAAAAGPATPTVLAGRARRARGDALAVSSSARVVVSAPAQAASRGVAVLERAPIATTDVLVDRLQLEMASTAGGWVLGTGIPAMSVAITDTSYQPLVYRSFTATFTEVG